MILYHFIASDLGNTDNLVVKTKIVVSETISNSIQVDIY